MILLVSTIKTSTTEIALLVVSRKHEGMDNRMDTTTSSCRVCRERRIRLEHERPLAYLGFRVWGFVWLVGKEEIDFG